MIRYLRSRRYFILFGIILLSLVFLPVFARLSVDTIFRPQIYEHNANLVMNYGRILNDLQTLDLNPIFPSEVNINNAEFLISKYVPWDGVEAPLYKNSRYDIVKKIYRSYSNWRTDDEVFKKMINDPDLDCVDTNWMQGLNNYDHWNYSTNREITSTLSNVSNVNALTRLEIFNHIPLPNYSDFRAWAMVNFLNMHRKGQSISGLKTYRKVAELIHSSGTLVGNMTAASMLKEEYGLVSKFSIKGWNTKPLYYIDSYIRVSWAWIGVLKAPYFAEFPMQFIPYLKPQNGICAASWASVSDFGLYLDFFQPQSFFESNFANNISITTKIFKKVQNDCNLAIYQRFLQRSPASLNPWSSFKMDEVIFKKHQNTDYDFSLEDNWVYLPYIRRLVGLVYFANGSPINYLVHYEGKRKKFAGVDFQDTF